MSKLLETILELIRQPDTTSVAEFHWAAEALRCGPAFPCEVPDEVEGWLQHESPRARWAAMELASWGLPAERLSKHLERFFRDGTPIAETGLWGNNEKLSGLLRIWVHEGVDPALVWSEARRVYPADMLAGMIARWWEPAVVELDAWPEEAAMWLKKVGRPGYGRFEWMREQATLLLLGKWGAGWAPRFNRWALNWWGIASDWGFADAAAISRWLKPMVLEQHELDLLHDLCVLVRSHDLQSYTYPEGLGPLRARAVGTRLWVEKGVPHPESEDNEESR